LIPREIGRPVGADCRAEDAVVLIGERVAAFGVREGSEWHRLCADGWLPGSAFIGGAAGQDRAGEGAIGTECDA
jgi:hypothetical protein